MDNTRYTTMVQKWSRLIVLVVCHVPHQAIEYIRRVVQSSSGSSGVICCTLVFLNRRRDHQMKFGIYIEIRAQN